MKTQLSTRNVSVFIKQEDRWYSLLQATLLEIYNLTFGKNFASQTLLDSDGIGAARITLGLLFKKDIDTLINEMPDVMVRNINQGNLSNPMNGELIFKARMKVAPRIDFDINETYSWQFSVNVNILEWAKDE